MWHAWRILPPELALLTAPYIREYFYTKIRLSTHGSAPTCKSVDTWCRSRRRPRTHACTQQQQLLHQHACRFMQHACRSMHAGSCIQHAFRIACRFMHAGPCMPVHAMQLLLMRARARRAYCKKCRVNLGSKSSGWPNVPVLISRCARTKINI